MSIRCSRGWLNDGWLEWRAELDGAELDGTAASEFDGLLVVGAALGLIAVVLTGNRLAVACTRAGATGAAGCVLAFGSTLEWPALGVGVITELAERTRVAPWLEYRMVARPTAVTSRQAVAIPRVGAERAAMAGILP